jgi:hypothetical protein
MTRAAAAWIGLLLLASCGATGEDAGKDAGPRPISGECDTSLRTGLVAQQTGISVDSVDCEILKWTAANHEPDPMLIKAIIYVESRFDLTSAGCPNRPCGTPPGWSDAETGCYGLMQVVPACRGESTVGLLPDGHPNLTTDMSSSSWGESIFNPDVNIQIGLAGLAGNRTEVEQLFPGCSVDQYTLMALGNYANHGSTQGCTQVKRDYIDIVLEAYRQYAAAAGYPARDYT